MQGSSFTDGLEGWVCSPEEMRILGDGLRDDGLIDIWAMKESQMKMMGGGPPIRSTPGHVRGGGFISSDIWSGFHILMKVIPMVFSGKSGLFPEVRNIRIQRIEDILST